MHEVCVTAVPPSATLVILLFALQLAVVAVQKLPHEAKLFTVTTAVVVLAHDVYVITIVPDINPAVTTPEELPMVATSGRLLLQVPPPCASDKFNVPVDGQMPPEFPNIEVGVP